MGCSLGRTARDAQLSSPVAALERLTHRTPPGAATVGLFPTPIAPGQDGIWCGRGWGIQGEGAAWFVRGTFAPAQARRARASLTHGIGVAVLVGVRVAVAVLEHRDSDAHA